MRGGRRPVLAVGVDVRGDRCGASGLVFEVWRISSSCLGPPAAARKPMPGSWPSVASRVSASQCSCEWLKQVGDEKLNYLGCHQGPGSR